MPKTLREMYAMIRKELEKQPSRPREEIFLEVLNKCGIPDDRENRRITYLINFRKEFPKPIRERSAEINQKTAEWKINNPETDLSLTDKFTEAVLKGEISKRNLEKGTLEFGERLKDEKKRRTVKDFPFSFR
jgi:hypothetical protein